ncbi:MAG: ABC transporter permease subunit [Alphaproteobacteria bacterium]|nr:ABC transporter permease subunit [Alphaproteobacteria bacterium]
MRRASTRLSKTILSMLIFGYAFLFIPIFFLIVTSFNESDIPSVWTGFSLKWFLAVFKDEELLRAALTSLEVACISATGAVVLGVLAAAATTSGSFKGKNFLNTTIIVPIVMPEIIIGFSLLMLFMSMENILGFPKERGIMTVATGHIVATMAYVHMTVRARLLSFDNSLEEAALDLGARPLTVFLQIKIPVIAKSILSGWLLAFTLSLDDLVIASFLSGPGSTTLPIMIFSNVRISISPCINALATLFIALVSTCLTIAFLIARKNKAEE